MNWELFILTTTMGVLSSLKKNPLNVPGVRNVLIHILNDLCTILGVQAPPVS